MPPARLREVLEIRREIQAEPDKVLVQMVIELAGQEAQIVQSPPVSAYTTNVLSRIVAVVY